MFVELKIATRHRTELIDITLKVQQAVRQTQVQEGLCHIWVPHTTAGVTINENADPSVAKDILMELNKVIPFEDHYHHLEGNSAAHIKSSLVGCAQTLIIHQGRVMLGSWQGIFFCEFDGPRHRTVWLKIFAQ